MTNIPRTQEANDVDTLKAPHTELDPIDQLIPRPRPWWVRLVVGLGVVLAVGTVSFLVGFGYLYPKPECCGSGSGGGSMVLAPDRESVVVEAYFFNSSGRELEILSADVDLPGAQVLDVGFVDSPGPAIGVVPDQLPAVIGGTGSAMISIRFMPEDCSTNTTEWGTIELRLDVVNAWLPSIDRTYRLPDPVVDRDQQSLNLLPPDAEPRWSQLREPLKAACAQIAGTPA